MKALCPQYVDLKEPQGRRSGAGRKRQLQNFLASSGESPFHWYHRTISFYHYLSLTSSLESQLNLQQVICCLLGVIQSDLQVVLGYLFINM